MVTLEGLPITAEMVVCGIFGAENILRKALLQKGGGIAAVSYQKNVLLAGHQGVLIPIGPCTAGVTVEQL